jgi:hypothetical protein
VIFKTKNSVFEHRLWAKCCKTYQIIAFENMILLLWKKFYFNFKKSHQKIISKFLKFTCNTEHGPTSNKEIITFINNNIKLNFLELIYHYYLLAKFYIQNFCLKIIFEVKKHDENPFRFFETWNTRFIFQILTKMKRNFKFFKRS